MASYYYLISSLPSLTTDSVPMDYQSFLNLCKSQVSASVYKELCEVSLGSKKGEATTAVAKQFSEFCSQMHSELSRQRRRKLGEKVSDQDYVDPVVKDCVERAMKASNPLEAENILLKTQFEYADTLCRMHYFDDYVLFSYAYRLKLLEKKTVFKHDNGKAEFDRLYCGIQKMIDRI